MSKKKASVIEGIQANNVTAEVLAVGRGAKAVKTVGIGAEELADTITQLRNALNELNIDHDTRKAANGDLDRLVTATRNKQPDKHEIGGILQSITRRLKSVGVVLSEAISLSESISKIAGLFGIALRTIL